MALSLAQGILGSASIAICFIYEFEFGFVKIQKVNNYCSTPYVKKCNLKNATSGDILLIKLRANSVKVILAAREPDISPSRWRRPKTELKERECWTQTQLQMNDHLAL